MTNHKPLSIAFSQEELFVILKHMNKMEMVGFNQDVFGQLDEQQLKLVAGVAERALIARGFLKPNAQHMLHLIPEVEAVTGTCADPDRSVIISRQEQNKPDAEYYFHNSRKMYVSHTIPMTAIHQFIAVEEMKDLERAAFSIIPYGDFSSKQKVEFDIRQTEFARIKEFDLTVGKVDDLVRSLTVVVDDKQALRDFINTLIAPLANTTFFAKNGEKLIGFTVVNDQNNWWLIDPGSADDKVNDCYNVKKLNSKELTSRIQSCFG